MLFIGILNLKTCFYGIVIITPNDLTDFFRKYYYIKHAKNTFLKKNTPKIRFGDKLHSFHGLG